MRKKTFADSLVDFIHRRPYLSYTLAFALASALVFFPFARYHKSFVTSQDGLCQDYTALMYYGKWLRGIAKSLISGNGFVVPLWDHSIGYGGDVITTFGPVVMGDPLNLLSAVVPARYTEYLFDLLVLVRLYLAGASFALFCLGHGKDHMGTLSAALVYAFCGWAIHAGTTNPMSVYPLICLPLLLHGIDLVSRRESPLPLVFSTCLSAMTCLTFAIELAICLALYTIGRFFSEHHESAPHELFSLIGRCFAFGCIGCALAGVLLCPAVNVLIEASRTMDQTKRILYGGSYYAQFLSAFITSDVDFISWRVLAYSSPVLLAVFALYSHEENRVLKYALATLTFFLLFTAWGNALNAFQYPTNRWAWVISFVIAYVLAEEWNAILQIDRKRRNLFVGALVVFLLFAAWAPGGQTTGFYASVSLIFVALSLVLLVGDQSSEEHIRNYLQAALLALVVVGLATNAYFHFDITKRNHIDDYARIRSCYKKAYNKTDRTLSKLTNADKFCRFDRQSTHIMNTAVITGSYGIESYLGTANPRLTQFLGEMGLGGIWLPGRCSNLDGRAYLEKLSSVRYYLADGRDTAPFGYDFVRTYRSRVICEDTSTLPLGYTYDRYMSRSVYEKLPTYAKQEALMQAVVVDDDKAEALSNVDRLTHAEASASLHAVSIESDAAIYRPNETAYSVKEDGASITLTFDGQPNCETYLHITGFYAKPKPLYDLYFDKYAKQLSKKSYRKLDYVRQAQLKNERTSFDEESCSLVVVPVTAGDRTVEFSYTMPFCTSAKDQTDYLVNLGYSEEGLHEATLMFPTVGRYVIEGIDVVCQPMDRLESYTSALSKDTLENIQVATNKVSGDIEVDDDKFLCLTIPYSEGWSAKIDGKETDLLVANTMFMGLPLTKGSHKIELTYRTPGLQAGTLLSLAGCVCVAAIAITGRSKR